ncbi:MAG: Lrp/AsnC family transcriptional regulator [Euryarchaeota archaeon]|nr:Lrp/AsnC family transcriptional regulator [Euryarchaeota archaeon]
MVSKVDKKILEILQQDVRTPVSKIAKEVGFSENGVRYRLEKLENDGYIKSYSILLNPKKFGKKLLTIFNLGVEPKAMRSILPKLVELDEFIKIYQTTGQFSINAIGLFDDEESLTMFINNKLLFEFPIQNYTVEIVMRKVKDTDYEI